MGVVRRDLKPGQSSLGPRLIAYGMIGIFCVPGPLGLLFALNLILHRAAFIHSLVVGIWGAVWSSIPVLILVIRRRRRASSGELTLPPEP
jgi:hypothetical protein